MYDFQVHDCTELKFHRSTLKIDVFDLRTPTASGLSFCTLRPWFWTNSWASRLFRVRTLGNTNLITSKHIRRGKGSFTVDLLKNVAAFTALLKNTRTLKFKGQLTFAYFAAVNHLSGPLRKQWSVIGRFRLACLQTPLPSGKVWEGIPSPIFPEGRGVCTQARFRSVLCVSVFHRSFLNFRVPLFWQGTSHPKSPRTTGNEAPRVCEKRSKLPQKFCYHRNVATNFFFLNRAANSPRSVPVSLKFAPVEVQ